MRPSKRRPLSPPGTCARRDPLDLEQVYAEYLDSMYHFLHARVGNREDAEDLTAQVFLKAFRQLDVARADRSIASWLFTVARTVLADHWRDKYLHGPVAELNENLTERTEAPSAQDDEKVQRVNELLALLPARPREILELRFLRGYSIEETARALGISVGNVKVTQHRALARAANLMDYGVACGSPSGTDHRSIA